jgi:integrase
MAGTIRKRSWTNRNGETRVAWQADYFDQNRVRHKKQFDTKREADRWLLQARGEVRDGVHTPDSVSSTVAGAAELWLKRGESNGLERGSIRAYEQYVRLGINPLIGNIRLSRLTRPRVESFRDELLERFAYQRARVMLGALRMILSHAQSRGMVAQNVARDVRIDDRPRAVEQLEIGRTIPTREEAARLFAGSDRWLRIMILLAASTGLRSGELRGLEWSAVDLKAERIIVRSRADQWGESGPPKSAAGRRTLDLTPAVAAELRQWWGTPGRHPVWVFPGRGQDTARPITQSMVTKSFADLQTALGIVDADGRPKYVFHKLRHFFASALIELDYNSKRLQAAMGHSRITTTFDTYGHLFPEPGDRAGRLAALESFVLGDRK